MLGPRLPSHALDGEQRILRSLREHYPSLPEPQLASCSVDSLQPYRRLIALYEQENSEIRVKNSQLQGAIREAKKKQALLQAEIAGLEQYHKKLIEKHNQEGKENICSKVLCLSSEKQSGRELEALGQEFAELAEASVKERDLAVRRKLRQELAALAITMKKLREESATDLEGYLGRK